MRNPRKRKDTDELFTSLFLSMAQLPFEKKERWDAVVEQMKAAGSWPKEAPADYEGHKKFIEENKGKLKLSKNFHLEMELDQLHQIYPYFDARRWRILKARDGTGGLGLAASTDRAHQISLAHCRCHRTNNEQTNT